MWDMPKLPVDKAIILGATTATAFLALAAKEAGFKKFEIVGGQLLKKEEPLFRPFLRKGIEAVGLPLPASDNLREHEYGRHVLRHLGVADKDIITHDNDRSKNFGANFVELKRQGRHHDPAVQLVALASTDMRVAATLRSVWTETNPVMSVLPVYPKGTARDNWTNNLTACYYAASEAAKILPFGAKPPLYEERGYCVPVDRTRETQRALEYVASVR